MAEHICRKILAVDEFYFAQRPILGRGRGCAATWKANKNGRASEIVSTFIPEYEFPGVSAALEGFDPFFFSMRTLSVAKKKDDIQNWEHFLRNMRSVIRNSVNLKNGLLPHYEMQGMS